MFQEKILQFLKENDEKPHMEMHMFEALSIDPIDQSTFASEIEALEDRGVIVKTKKGKIALPEFFQIYLGRVQSTSKGFGFVVLDNGMEDVFIPAGAMKGAMNGDRVQIKIMAPQKRGGGSGSRSERSKLEGEIIRILHRANTEIVGTYTDTGRSGFVIPDDQKIRKDIYVAREHALGAKPGDKVVVSIHAFPEDRRNPEGEVIEVLGQNGTPGIDILSVIRQFKLPEVFPPKVLRAAEQVNTEVPASDLEGREDFRQYTVITIDGKDAKDLDDAIHIRKLDNGNDELGVHIADVTHYVSEGSAIDKEAFKRGTSVYLLNRVLPMLPEQLSNGICSLNPNVDRLTLSCIMEIDGAGDVVSHRICEGVIRSTERMNYEDVSNMLEDGMTDALQERYAAIISDLQEMKRVAERIRDKRTERGAINFDFAETEIKLDGEGHPISVGKRERRIGHKMIEDFMLVANETVAEHAFWLELPFVYRIHETPSPEKIQALNTFLHHFGHRVKGNPEAVHPKAIQTLLDEVEGLKEEHVVSKMALRSLRQARYAPSNDGHFGLAAKYYCHFTSPIRRYPDLEVHRILKEMLKGRLGAERIQALKGIVEAVSEESSKSERQAELAERDVDDMKMAEYMQAYVGEVFKGIVSSVTSFGLFIELENTIEGLLHIENLDDDYYVFDEKRLTLLGERHKKVYALGDPIEVVVVGADPVTRRIDFDLPEAE